MELYFHSITNLTEARFAASVYPKFLGFSFSVHSPNYISPVDFSKISPWLAGADIVGQFSYEPARSIQAVLENLQIEWLEVPADHPDLPTLKKSFNLICTDGKTSLADFSRNGGVLSSTEDCLPNTFYEIDSSVNQATTLIQDKKPFGIALKGGYKETDPGMADLSYWSGLMEELDIL